MKTHGDAGWQSHPSYLDAVVPRILAFLAERRLTITFFIVGQDAALEKNRAALRSISAAGHEIGNHSFRHEPWLHLYTASRARRGAAPGRRSTSRPRPACARAAFAGRASACRKTRSRHCAAAATTTTPPCSRPAEPAGPRLPLLDQQAHGRGEGAAQRACSAPGRTRCAPVRPFQWKLQGGQLLRDSGHDAAGAQGADALFPTSSTWRNSRESRRAAACVLRSAPAA